MRKSIVTDQTIYIISLFYIGIPFIIFLFGWLQPFISIPFSIIFCYSIYLVNRSYLVDNHILEKIITKPKIFLFTIFILFIWLFFSGIGSFSFQNEDHHFRNAIFQDLVSYPWPVIYNIKGFAADNPLEGKQAMLVYYLAYWLPAAEFGKIFGLKLASFFLYFWTVVGVILILYNLSKYFQKYSMRVLWLFMAWGTLYFIGTIIKFPIKEILKGNTYLWAGNLLYADGNVGLIYWTFNQTMVPWLIILLIINQLNPKNVLFLTSLLFFHGPFSFIGFIPFMALFILEKELKSVHFFKDLIIRIKPYLTFQNILGSISILFITFFYFKSNMSGSVFNVILPNITSYLIFVLLSIGIIFLLIFDFYKSNLLYYFTMVFLLVIPFFQLGFGLDFVARVSIPAMFILMLLVGKFLIKSENSWQKKAVIGYLIIAGFGHNMQFSRSVYYTGIQWISNTNVGETLVNTNIQLFEKLGKKILLAKGKNITTKNKLGTLSNPENVLVRNFMGPLDQSFFYKYLAKKDAN